MHSIKVIGSGLLLSAIMAGCGSSTVPPENQLPQNLRTSIEPGVYAGEVSCNFERRNGAVGLVDQSTYEFEETVTFGDMGLPNAGVQYDPQNDQVEFSGIVFDVTNRTHDASETRYIQEAALVGMTDGIRINGTITWLFTYSEADTVVYNITLTWSYRSAGVSWTEYEDCQGTLGK